MTKPEKFTEHIRQGYSSNGTTALLGAAMLQGEVLKGVAVSAPLRTFNRHGLIAGATGTGKTKTLQRLAESLSKAGVLVLLMDVKGDLSGLSQAGENNPKTDDRHARIGLPWKPESFPIEFMTISDEKGVRLRATVSEFGPVLFSKILELNETQASVVSVVFKYCDDKALPLLDLRDFKKVVQFVTNDGKKEVEAEYGRISTATTGLIIRKIVELEQQGADVFFGERSFDVDDFLKIDDRGYGTINVLRLIDMQSKPKLFSTFMLCLLAEIYATFPEEGDLEQPKLVMFIDEAHLIFNEASKSLLDQLETIVKLIRSKGIGVFFCTQSPADIPPAILGQLGMKIQHALRAFTAQDRKAIKLASENYPETDYYKTDEVLTSMGIGEALITCLNEQGIPTPLVHTMMCAPESRMAPISDQEFSAAISSSSLVRKYGENIDRESAYEMLSAKLSIGSTPIGGSTQEKTSKPEKSTFEKVIDDPLTRQVGRTVARELTRGLLGIFGFGGRRR